MNDKKFLKIIDEFGCEMKYEILCAFKLEKTKKNYVVYTDNTTNEEGDLNVYASVYYKDDNTKLGVIETEEEWNEVDKRLKDLRDNQEVN